MQLSQLLNMTVPTSAIQGNSLPGDSENKEGDNNLFDSLLEMYISPDKLMNLNDKSEEELSDLSNEKNNDLIKAISKLNSEGFINEIKDALKSADEKAIFFFDDKNGNAFKELLPNLKISKKQIDNLVNLISSFNFGDRSAIVADLGNVALKDSKISEFLHDNNFIFKNDDKSILTFKKIKSGQFLIEKNQIGNEGLENFGNKIQNTNMYNNKDQEKIIERISSKKYESNNKILDKDFLNNVANSKNLKDLSGNNFQNSKNLTNKNVFHLNESNVKTSSRKNLTKDKIESSEDILFLKNKFNNKKPNLNSLNKYMNFSENENVKEASSIDRSDNLNLIHKSKNKDLQVGLNQNLKVINSSKSENSEELMNMESNDNSEVSSPKIALNSNKIPNISKNISIGNTMPFEITSENNSLEALVNKVGDYIKGHYNKSDENLSLTVKHDLIGKFKLDVTENADKSIQVRILTGTDDGKLFFSRNESEISNNLKNLGLKISEMKIIAGSDTISDSNNSFDSEKNQNSENGKSQKYSDQDESRKNDSQRRKDLWERYKERMDS